jgi:hypothetical protein
VKAAAEICGKTRAEARIEARKNRPKQEKKVAEPCGKSA